MNAKDPKIQEIAEAIVRLNPLAGSKAARAAFEAGVDILTIVEQGVASGMEEVGRRYEADEFHLPELLMAEETMRACMAAITEATAGSDVENEIAAAQERLLELSRTWVGQLSSCVTRLFRYAEERKKAAQS
jgi:dimethylamine corrinoid protein